MIKKKQAKKFAWIKYGKKELTPSERTKIEKLIEQNFSEEKTVIERPREYSYIEVKLFLNKARFTVGKNDGVKA
jgi:hypothetical protein